MWWLHQTYSFLVSNVCCNLNLNFMAASFGPVVTLAQTPLKNVTHVGEGGGAQPGWMDGWAVGTEIAAAFKQVN